MSRPDLFRLLKTLPVIRFALMLGGGMVATAGVAWIVLLVGHGAWPSAVEVAVARINGLTALGLAAVAIVGVVMIALAWGRLERVSASFNGAAVEIGLSGADVPAKPEEPAP